MSHQMCQKMFVIKKIAQLKKNGLIIVMFYIHSRLTSLEASVPHSYGTKGKLIIFN